VVSVNIVSELSDFCKNWLFGHNVSTSTTNARCPIKGSKYMDYSLFSNKNSDKIGSWWWGTGNIGMCQKNLNLHLL